MPGSYEEACAAMRATQEALAAREVQLERKSREVADTEAMCRRLQARPPASHCPASLLRPGLDRTSCPTTGEPSLH